MELYPSDHIQKGEYSPDPFSSVIGLHGDMFRVIFWDYILEKLTKAEIKAPKLIIKRVGHVAGMGEMTNPYEILVRNLNGEDHSEDLGVDGKIILKYILWKYYYNHHQSVTGIPSRGGSVNLEINLRDGRPGLNSRQVQ
jgi:hypothetical protein